MDQFSDNWIIIANLLDVPNLMISTINVITSHQQNEGDALYKVVEWWFTHTANPEWTTIDEVIKRTESFVNEGDYTYLVDSQCTILLSWFLIKVCSLGTLLMFVITHHFLVVTSAC